MWRHDKKMNCTMGWTFNVCIMNEARDTFWSYIIFSFIHVLKSSCFNQFKPATQELSCLVFIHTFIFTHTMEFVWVYDVRTFMHVTLSSNFFSEIKLINHKLKNWVAKKREKLFSKNLEPVILHYSIHIVFIMSIFFHYDFQVIEYFGCLFRTYVLYIYVNFILWKKISLRVLKMYEFMTDEDLVEMHILLKINIYFNF